MYIDLSLQVALLGYNIRTGAKFTDFSLHIHLRSYQKSTELIEIRWREKMSEQKM